MSFSKKKQDPEDILDYTINWRGKQPFLASSESITSSDWSFFDADWATSTVPVEVSSSNTATTATLFVKFPTASPGDVYYATNHIVTDQGREKDLSIQFTIEEQ